MTQPLILIDSSNLAYRCHHVNQRWNPETKRREPFQFNNHITSAIYGFFKSLLMCRRQYPDSEIVCAFDSKSAWRHELVGKAQEEGHFEKKDGYKAQRQHSPDRQMVFDQLDELLEVLPATRVHVVKIQGQEADDIVGSYAVQHQPALICSSDHDFYQLISESISVYDAMKNKLMNLQAFGEMFPDLEPKQMVEVGALMGDTSDNIPGIKGVGEKTALGLIRQYGTVLKALDILKNDPPKKIKKAESLLLENEEKVLYCHRLKAINTDLDLPGIEVNKETNQELLTHYFTDIWGFKSLTPRIKDLL